MQSKVEWNWFHDLILKRRLVGLTSKPYIFDHWPTASGIAPESLQLGMAKLLMLLHAPIPSGKVPENSFLPNERPRRSLHWLIELGNVPVNAFSSTKINWIRFQLPNASGKEPKKLFVEISNWSGFQVSKDAESVPLKLLSLKET